jgi:flagellar basal body P-ring formation protein FlgA
MSRLTRIGLWCLSCCLLWGMTAAPDGSAAVLKEDAIKRIVVEHIQRHMPWEQENMRLTFLGGCNDIVVPAPDYTCDVQEQPNDPYIGDSIVILKLHHGGVFLLERPVRVRVEVAFDVLVSTRALPVDTVIGPDDVRVVKRWLTREPQRTIAIVEEALEKRVINSIRPNHEITRTMLREVPLVKKGRMVKMVLNNGTINITTLGQTQEDGSMGSSVKVKNVSSQRIVYARVVGESLVQVDF